MEIQPSNSNQSQQTVQVVTIQEFSQLVSSLPRKRQPAGSVEQRLIYGVPPHLRMRQPPSNKRVYDPEVISLGPYHHGKPELSEAEEFKHLSLDWFAEGDENKKLLLYNKVLEKINGIRGCYADITIAEKYDDKRLALMMLLDACFIINLMNNCTCSGLNDQLDWLDSRSVVASIQILISDVFVLENQIPFGVIQLLMSLQYQERTEELVQRFLGWTLKLNRKPKHSLIRINEDPPIHILEACWRVVVETPEGRKVPHITIFNDRKTLRVSYRPCNSVMELKAKGIHFKPSPSRSVTDITFSSHAGLYAELKLPLQNVSPQTQVMLSNLIAFEVSHSGVILAVLAYVIFMKSLIETPADVKELLTKGILINSLPSHEQAVKVFSEIDTFAYEDFDIFAQVKYYIGKHCRSRAKTWIADLIHTRFRTPWSAIAFCAAIALLILTFMQTWYTIHPVE